MITKYVSIKKNKIKCNLKTINFLHKMNWSKDLVSGLGYPFIQETVLHTFVKNTRAHLPGLQQIILHFDKMCDVLVEQVQQTKNTKVKDIQFRYKIR